MTTESCGPEATTSIETLPALPATDLSSHSPNNSTNPASTYRHATSSRSNVPTERVCVVTHELYIHATVILSKTFDRKIFILFHAYVCFLFQYINLNHFSQRNNEQTEICYTCLLLILIFCCCTIWDVPIRSQHMARIVKWTSYRRLEQFLNMGSVCDQHVIKKSDLNYQYCHYTVDFLDT